MTFAPAKAGASSDSDGHKIYFCCQGCADAFDADPGKFGGVSDLQPERG
ncbi:MAG: hypothetical protein ACYDBS_00005 [Acidimicrobiales bacterium]